jgi:hypothetical protein
MKQLLFTLVFFVLLSGCDSTKSLADLCKENPEICKEFGDDNWCKAERVELILSRISLKNQKRDSDKYKLLIAYEGYVKCMSLASQIQHIKLKEKTASRKQNLFKAQAHLAELTDQTSESKHPHLLFYHWSRELNEHSLQLFIELEGSQYLENALSQYHLASYYAKKDINKTIGLLFHSLELHEPNEKLIPEVFQTLTTIFTNKGNQKQAYIWLKVYQLSLNKNMPHVDKAIDNHVNDGTLNIDLLDQVAENTLMKIKKGQFKAPKY